MFAFKSPASPNNIWKLCFRPKEEMTKIFYEDRTPEEGIRIFGVTEYLTSTVYIDKELDGFPLEKTLRHELTHIYLWETGNQGHVYDEEELVDIVSVAAPSICKSVNDIMLRLKEGLYKHG